MELVNYRDNGYHSTRHKEYIENDELMRAWSHYADAAYFSGVSAGMKVLEFGGGLGNNLLTVCKRADVTMIEPSEIGRTYASKAGIHVAPTLQSVKEGEFDYVLCRHVLEHLDDPLGTLRELRSVLKPGGHLILVVPYERSDLQPDTDDIDFHLYCWNPQTLTNLVRRAGFGVERHWFGYYGAKRRLLPVYRYFGGPHYARLVKRIGRLFSFRELVFDAVNPKA